MLLTIFYYILLFKKSYESCPLEEWKNRRDGRPMKENWDVLTEYWASEAGRDLFYMNVPLEAL